jgi:hypothetical protein
MNTWRIASPGSPSTTCPSQRSEGIARPLITAHDAQVWVHKHFNAPFGLPLSVAMIRDTKRHCESTPRGKARPPPGISNPYPIAVASACL